MILSIDGSQIDGRNYYRQLRGIDMSTFDEEPKSPVAMFVLTVAFIACVVLWAAFG